MKRRLNADGGDIVLKLLIENDAKIHHTGEDCVHELYRAAEFGNYEMARFFLDNGVSASITDGSGRSPLHAASANGHTKCVKLLFEHRANPSPISDEGFTPLDLVDSGKVYYDQAFLGEDPEHYLDGRPYQEMPEGQLEWDRREDIRGLLRGHGAKAAEELYAEDTSAL